MGAPLPIDHPVRLPIGLPVGHPLEDLPTRGLYRGQVGTIVEALAPGVFEVEFSDEQARAYASLTLKGEQLLTLRYEPA